MSAQALWNLGTAKVLATAAGTAVAAGMLVASWVQLPPGLGDAYVGEPQQIVADDPGLAQWRQVIAELGGLGATFVIPMAYYSPPAAMPVAYDPVADAEFQRLTAEVDAHLDGRWREAEDARRQELMRIQAQVDREAAQARDYAYAIVRAPPTAREYVRYQRVDAPQDEVEVADASPPEPPAAW